MISFSEAQLHAWLAGFVWPLARILALVMVAPVIGNEAVPARFRVGMGALIALAVAPLAPPPQGVEMFSGAGLLVLVQQVLVGIAMGFAMRIVFAMVDLAGELAGLQMGLGFAAFFDPQNATSSSLVAQYLGILVGLVFLALNGHLLVIGALAESFQVLPMSAEWPHASMWMSLTQWGGQIFAIGLTLCLPLLAALLIANLALAVLTRAAPQLNVFSVGFPITLMLGFALLILILPQFGRALEQPLQLGVEMMLRLAASAKGH